MSGPRALERRLCAFQMHHTDADPALIERSAVRRALESGLFDHVVLAAADVPENRRLERYADAWGVELFYGPERDVARRILECAEAYGCGVIARGLVWWFFQDLDLVARLLDALEDTGADYVRLPRDFDIRFGADVFRPEFLRKVLRAFEDPGLRRRFELNPWGYAEAYPGDFAIATFEAVPVLGEAEFHRLRSEMRRSWPERWDGAGSSLFPYRLAASLLPAGGGTLDVACGLGAGTALLGARGDALGVDSSSEAIALCRERHGGAARFLRADAMELDPPGAPFDLVTSVHTMEHLEEDRAFLERLAGWLTPRGRLVLEVPLLARYPFRDVCTPLSPGHVREYEAEGLCELVSERFRIEEAYGVNRGGYVDLDDARSAALLVASVRSGVA